MKKILALSLMATLTIGLFVGCQNTEPEAQVPAETNTETAEVSEQDKQALEKIDKLEQLGALEEQVITLDSIDNSILEGVESASKDGFIKSSTAESFLEKADTIKDLSDFKALMRENEGDPNRAPFLITYYTDDLINNSSAAGSLMKTVMVFPIESEEESSALYVEARFNKVFAVTVDAFNGTTSDQYDDFQYKLTINPGVDFYTEPEGFDFVMASMKNLGKTFDDFAAEYDVNNHYATIQGKDQTVETRLYFLNDGLENEDSMYFFEVISKDGQIIKVNKIEARIDLTTIGKYFLL